MRTYAVQFRTAHIACIKPGYEIRGALWDTLFELMSTDEHCQDACFGHVILVCRIAPGSEYRGGQFRALTKGGWPQNALAYLLHRPGQDNSHTPGYRTLQSFDNILGVPANECFVVDKEVMETIAPDAIDLRVAVITEIGGSSQFSSSRWKLIEMDQYVDLNFPNHCK